MGLGCVGLLGQQTQCLAYESLKLNADIAMPQRLLTIYKTLTFWVEQWQPEAIALEKVFLAENFKSSMVLGQVRGVVMLVAAQNQIPLFEYAPTQIKLAIVGVGRAEKRQMQHMVKALLKLEHLPASDAADALAIALCHLAQNPHLSTLPALGSSKSSALLTGKSSAKKTRQDWARFVQEKLPGGN